MKTSTKKAYEVYLLALEYLQNYQRFPPYRWIVDNHPTITSTSMVSFYIDILEDKGYIKKKYDGKFSRWYVPGVTIIVPRARAQDIQDSLNNPSIEVDFTEGE